MRKWLFDFLIRVMTWRLGWLIRQYNKTNNRINRLSYSMSPHDRAVVFLDTKYREDVQRRIDEQREKLTEIKGVREQLWQKPSMER
jgi:hypothetical protein